MIIYSRTAEDSRCAMHVRTEYKDAYRGDDRYKMYDLQTSIVLGYRGFILYLSAVYNPKSNKEVHHSWQKLN